MREITPYQRRVIHKEYKNFRLIAWLLLFFLGLSAVFFFQSPYSTVQDVKIKGLSLLHAEKLKQDLGLAGNPTILKLRPQRMEEVLRRNPIISQATVTYLFPNRIQIQIQENQPVAVLVQNDQRMLVLENGALVDEDKQEGELSLPIVQAPLDWAPLGKLGIELIALPQELLRSVLFIQPETLQENSSKIALTMKEGYMVRTTVNQLAKKMTPYPEIAHFLQSEGKDGGVIYLTDEASWYQSKEEGDQ